MTAALIFGERNDLYISNQ